MATEQAEKRGPIEKGEKGWPINPLGVVALIVFALIIVFLIGKPLLSQKTSNVIQPSNSAGGKITTPQAGQIIKGDKITIELSVDEPQKVQKVLFWAKNYVDNKWEIIGQADSAPYKLDWQIPANYQNKAIALTTHIYNNDGNIIKDPGGWREGIIILSQ